MRLCNNQGLGHINHFKLLLRFYSGATVSHERKWLPITQRAGLFQSGGKSEVQGHRQESSQKMAAIVREEMMEV